LAVYTPLKQRSWLNTVVGAVAGALPILMGWSAVGGELSIRAASMFMILFLWQFPHFMAIAWMYRRQYGQAGHKMLTVVDPSPPACSLYVTLAFLLGVGQLICAVMFLALRTDAAARILLRASLIYLPALWLLLMFVPLM
jgi:protoheme IX farnesyltransferase